MKYKSLVTLSLIGILSFGAVGCDGMTSNVSTEETQKQETEVENEAENIVADKQQDSNEDGQNLSVDEENQENTSSENDTREILEQVLVGKRNFRNADDGQKESYLNSFQYFNGAEIEQPLNLMEYAFVDMDQDGQEEAIVLLDAGYDGAYEILHCYEGEVYGYQLSFRSIQTLYDNGYCLGSGGADTWGIYKLSFTNTEYSQVDIAGCENGNYYLQGETATAAEYDEFVADFTEAQWYSFDSSNLENAEDTGETQNASQNTFQALAPSVVGESSYTMFPYQYEYLAEEDFKYMPKDLLRIARNEIYAMHGYIFKAEDLKEFFSYKDWYEGTVNASDWQDSVLNEYEKKNLELISKLEKEEHTALEVEKDGDGTKLTDGDFVIILPSEWSDDNYYVTKTEDATEVNYIFNSKNNVLYGFGGHVFTLTKSKDVQSNPFGDNLIELGKHGNYYYYMSQSTDVQHSTQHDVLAKEWSQLSNTYNEIADSFVAN